MFLFRRSYTCIPAKAHVIAALGNFDGMHLGHQKLLRRAIELRDECSLKGQKAIALVISFAPHPISVISKENKQPFISTIPQKLQWASEIGVDFFNLIHFTSAFSEVSAKDFVNEILIKKARVKHLIIGADARVGFKGEGDAQFLKNELTKSGSVLEVLQFEMYQGQRISSGLLRILIEEGRIAEAWEMLGRPFQMEGKVLRGEQLGRRLGFPTLNLKPREQITPPRGVYITQTTLPNWELSFSITNIGVRPTFDGGELRVETYLMDYKGPTLYDKRIEVSFLKKLRDEERFSSIEALKEQMRKDEEKAREYFKCR
ncbi:MAG: bifunctional riboflavin kinase/FAD synthetase [SAR324 cluster bacterium]|uniref:Riboflavin biosynthesis protein n=1 Tax=SAR324 cluster bacterium TaxID=2024889 RepID=A0A7X9FUK9_9DELT|nr:bifunctional riboflavin kinase/FAD synthetase [SAR324 cluster bacterium]